MTRRLSPSGMAACRLLAVMASRTSTAAPVIEAISFSVEPGNLYVPVDEACRELRWHVRRDEAGRCLALSGVAFPAGSLQRLMDGTEIIHAGDLQKAGATFVTAPAGNVVTVSHEGRSWILTAGPKRVEINLPRQQLSAWQGRRPVLQNRVSSGRHGSTPSGEFRAGPHKAWMHDSSLFQHAPMPWSVQINGHVFIHGFTYVPDFPASHRCIRLPLDGLNPARFFYEWVDHGSPVRVMRS